MTDPELLLLDEPTASLDLGAREDLLTLLGGYAQAPTTPAMVMVTHHVEEIPVGFTPGDDDALEGLPCPAGQQHRLGGLDYGVLDLP